MFIKLTTEECALVAGMVSLRIMDCVARRLEVEGRQGLPVEDVAVAAREEAGLVQVLIQCMCFLVRSGGGGFVGKRADRPGAFEEVVQPLIDFLMGKDLKSYTLWTSVMGLLSDVVDFVPDMDRHKAWFLNHLQEATFLGTSDGENNYKENQTALWQACVHGKYHG
jgi:hypothetical protein